MATLRSLPDPEPTPPQLDPDKYDDELTRVVKEYMPLVRHAVNRVVAGSSQSSILQYEDMVSCGVQGLLEAHRTYDPDRGAKFSTYALPRIRGAILDALRAAHPLVRERPDRAAVGGRPARTARVESRALDRRGCLAAALRRQLPR